MHRRAVKLMAILSSDDSGMPSEVTSGDKMSGDGLLKLIVYQFK